MRAILITLTLALLTTSLPGQTSGGHGSKGNGGAGGSYPGPKDIVPTASSSSPAPTSSAPDGGGGATGVPNSAGPRTSGLTYVPPAITPTSTPWDDPSSWRHWWVLNREPYMGLKAIASRSDVLTGSDDFFLGQGEGREQREITLVEDGTFYGEVVPALTGLLKSERDGNLQALILIALAEGGAGRAGAERLVKVITPYLDSGRVSVAESATAALGVLGRTEGAEVLIGMLHCYAQDLASDHGLDFGAHVAPRQRAFAAYALGLLGGASKDGYWRARIANELAQVVMNDQHGSHELRAAAIVGLGLVPLPIADAAKPIQPKGLLTSRQEQVRWLLGALDEPDFDSRVRSQVPVSIARLLADAGPDFPQRPLATLRIATLMGDRAGEQIPVRRGCAQALGWLLDSDEGKLDRTGREALIEAGRNASDQGVRRFAWIALARAAGRPGTEGEVLAGVAAARKALAAELESGGTPMRPWAAVAVGVLERALLDGGRPASPEMRAALRKALADARTLEEVGACAIGIGLARDTAAGALLRKEFKDNRDPETRGDLALALGMIQERAALDTLRATCADSLNQPALLQHLAMGLALLGDKEIGAQLEQLLDEQKSASPSVNLLAALGRVGASHTVARLVAAALDTGAPTASRAAAVGALGRVVELGMQPWAARLSVGSSYRSDVVTLTTVPRGDGVLDLRP